MKLADICVSLRLPVEAPSPLSTPKASVGWAPSLWKFTNLLRQQVARVVRGRALTIICSGSDFPKPWVRELLGQKQE